MCDLNCPADVAGVVRMFEAAQVEFARARTAFEVARGDRTGYLSSLPEFLPYAQARNARLAAMQDLVEVVLSSDELLTVRVFTNSQLDNN